MDKFIVRLSILLLNAYMIISTIFAFNGVDISHFDYLFANSGIAGVLLTTLCHAQRRYHCVWMRMLCYNLIIIPILNFLDSIYTLFNTVEQCIYIFCSVIGTNIIITIILAIAHFCKVQSITKKKYEEHKPIECDSKRKGG